MLTKLSEGLVLALLVSALIHAPLAAQAPPAWMQMATTGPAARGSHAMAYDSQRGATVLFGGVAGIFTISGDTWEWNGSSWTQMATTGPAARTQHAMAFDSQ